ncbi:ectoine dioxygenase-like [Saccoglossus kowalevskii]
MLSSRFRCINFRTLRHIIPTLRFAHSSSSNVPVSQRPDYYPTRQNSFTILPRTDPVVWNKGCTDGPLTAAQIAQYEDEGYLIIRNFFNEEKIRILRADVKNIQRELEESLGGKDSVLSETVNLVTEPRSGRLRSIFAAHKHYEKVDKFTRHPILLNSVKQILADDVYIFQNRINFQEAFEGTGFYWHSDFETWHTEDGMPRIRAMSCVIFLDKNACQNGALMVIPGSHKLFFSCAGTAPDHNWETSLKLPQAYGVPSREQVTGIANKQGIKYCTGDPGTIILFDSNLMHGSHSNLSPWGRTNIFTVYNSITNKLIEPYTTTACRPEHLATRDPEMVQPIKSSL